jgi:hypothetical protein
LLHAFVAFCFVFLLVIRLDNEKYVCAINTGLNLARTEELSIDYSRRLRMSVI